MATSTGIDIKSEVNERIKGPVLGPFLMAWATLNWELIFRVTGPGSVNEKIELIKSASSVFRFLVLPLVISILVTVVIFLIGAGLAYLKGIADTKTIERIDQYALQCNVRLSDLPKAMGVVSSHIQNVASPVFDHLEKVARCHTTLITAGTILDNLNKIINESNNKEGKSELIQDIASKHKEIGEVLKNTRQVTDDFTSVRMGLRHLANLEVDDISRLSHIHNESSPIKKTLFSK